MNEGTCQEFFNDAIREELEGSSEIAQPGIKMTKKIPNDEKAMS